MSTFNCLTEGPFNRTEVYGIPAFNIVSIIIFTSIVSKHFDLPNWIFIIPVAFVLYKVFCINSVFFNQENSGVVSRVVTSVS